MLYLLDYGPIEQTLARQAYQNHQPLPPAIENAPELQLGLYLYLQAFFDLDAERSTGFGATRIPGSAIRSYAREFEFDDTQTDLLTYFVSAMDNAYIERQEKKADAKSKGAKSP